MLSDLQLMELHVAISFRHDARGRLLAVNEPEPDKPAPRLYLGRTTARNIWRFRADLPEILIHKLDALLQTEPVATELRQPPAILPALTEILQPFQDLTQGPAWHFSEHLPSLDGIVPITAANVAVCHRHFPWTAAHLADLQPCRAVLVDGDAVSLCFSSRNTPAACAAGVFTVEDYRARGYAAAVVVSWAHAVRESGRVAFYSKSWNNLASQAVAKKLGLVLYASDLSLP
ncbi:MAG: GNAT family N-acetyltransferase [Chloroflexota bacterium]|nr:GNAT family N-acetyltransferase [Chloroflexota bacterium]